VNKYEHPPAPIHRWVSVAGAIAMLPHDDDRFHARGSPTRWSRPLFAFRPVSQRNRPEVLPKSQQISTSLPDALFHLRTRSILANSKLLPETSSFTFRLTMPPIRPFKDSRARDFVPRLRDRETHWILDVGCSMLDVRPSRPLWTFAKSTTFPVNAPIAPPTINMKRGLTGRPCQRSIARRRPRILSVTCPKTVLQS